ncbi:RNA polymerase sigma factor [Piscinibacter koreensis]|uniref:RNA polymerase sigma factor n=1 Tax=Piscinibacter koreensis TaxID=2742824 RepID=A0A7Y6TUX6_9BURK|nr:RNA polymerase sigma factor [Schlegelella koreensis]NUZ04504.1 RNA polymerase sigma factor [Schlegelella koreensis]
MSGADGERLLVWLPRLRRYARALAGRREDADDLVQDTLERAWAQPHLWRAVADMRAWLFGIMHNAHVDGVRRRRVATVPLDADDGPEPQAPAAPHDRLLLLDLQSALAALPIEQREVLLLVGLEDMSYADAARTLGVPIGTVMSRLSRGRERLRALMEGRAEPVRLKVVSK